MSSISFPVTSRLAGYLNNYGSRSVQNSDCKETFKNACSEAKWPRGVTPHLLVHLQLGKILEQLVAEGFLAELGSQQ